MIAAHFEPNPRAVLGGNFPPPDDDDNTEPTIEEARIVASAIAYLQFKVSDLEEVLTKRKGGRILGWRLALANCLKGRVRQNSIRKLLGYNRKTMGENQQRADMWAEHDDEHGDGSFGDLMERLRHAFEADYQVDAPALEKKLKHYVRIDPDLRRIEEQRREHEAAAAEAEAAAADLERRAKERARDLKAQAVAKSLKGVKGAGAIVAEHIGAKKLAATISDGAIAVIEKTVKADMKAVEKTGKADARGALKLTSELDAAGLRECKKFGLVRESIPHLAPKPDDPPIAPTDLGRRVFLEAVKLKRIRVKKRKAA